MKVSSLVYRHFNLPVSYVKMSWDSLDVTKVRVKHLIEKLKSAPKRGLLVIRGCAAPIINQQVSLDKSVIGIDFPERANKAFETIKNPRADIILIYGVGDEVTTNYNISRQVLQAILAYYKTQDTLVVLETKFTLSELRTNYDLHPSNFLNLQEKEEKSFL